MLITRACRPGRFPLLYPVASTALRLPKMVLGLQGQRTATVLHFLCCLWAIFAITQNIGLPQSARRERENTYGGQWKHLTFLNQVVTVKPNGRGGRGGRERLRKRESPSCFAGGGRGACRMGANERGRRAGRRQVLLLSCIAFQLRVFLLRSCCYRGCCSPSLGLVL